MLANFRLLVFIRLMHFFKSYGSLKIARILRLSISIFFSADISPNAVIGAGLRIPHPRGVIIGGTTKIGKS